ncbi:MAG: hypothetical protein M3347_04295, partial [Armatimonadota bacterium]|nr:hypothetical protein [Armatimonadota bacterium]
MVNRTRSRNRWVNDRLVLILALFLSSGWRAVAAEPEPPASSPKGSSAASSFDAQYRQARWKTPREIKLTAILTEGNITFRPGESMGLELGFTSSQPATYTLNATTDGSDRVNFDAFHVTPDDGVVDPLQDYFRSGLDGVVVPTARAEQRAVWFIDEKPKHVILELNEWLRFTRPGWYRLYVTSNRLVNERLAGRYGDTGNRPVASNVVEFEILPPDPRWANQQLRRAVRILEKNKKKEEKNGTATPSTATPSTATASTATPVIDPKLILNPKIKVADLQKELRDRRTASRSLRFLGTPEATREMARLFDGSDPESDAQFALGLIGAPDRALALQEMEKQLDAPDHPVPQSFIRTLAVLSFLAQHPAPPALSPDEKPKRQEEFVALVKQYEERLAAAVATKEGPARGMSLYTLLERALGQIESTPTPPQVAWLKKLTKGLVETFEQLPPHVQATLLESRWQYLAGPDLLPALRRIYLPPEEEEANKAEEAIAQAANGQLAKDQTASESREPAEQPAEDPEVRRLRSLALRRLYQLEPEEGRSRIRQEIRSPQPRINLDVLRLLPDETLPDVEKELVTYLEQSQSDRDDAVYSGLIARYATPAVLPRIKKLYDNWTFDCPAQAALLAYFLRVEPRLGVRLVREALADRTGSQCQRSLLNEIAPFGLRPEVEKPLEKIAVAQLQDPDPAAVADAAAFLGRYGSAEAKPALWARLKQWQAEWKIRQNELRLLRAGNSPIPPVAQLETVLWQALAYAPAWLMDKPQLAKLQTLVVTQNARQEIDAVIAQWGGPIRVTYKPGIGERWQVAQYEL